MERGEKERSILSWIWLILLTLLLSSTVISSGFLVKPKASYALQVADTGFRFPFDDPFTRYSGFNDPSWRCEYHNGVDYHKAYQAKVRAVANGEVIVKDYDPNGYGYWVAIKHQLPVTGEVVYSVYSHLDSNQEAPDVSQPEVSKGDVIGKEGDSGSSGDAVHLHFELRRRWNLQEDHCPYTPEHINQWFYNPDEFIPNHQSSSQPQDAPSSLFAVTTDKSSIRLTWNDNSDSEDGFKIFRYGSLIATVGANIEVYEDTGLSCDTTYWYYIKAYNSSGDSEKSNTVVAMTGSCPTADPSGELLDQKDTRVVRAIDPNDKLGPAGVGSARVVSKDDELAYTVRFENMSTATAPVQELVVVDYLDSNLDWTTFQFSEVAYGNRLIPLPADVLEFATRDFPTSPTITGATEGEMAIDVIVIFNPQTGRVEWRLKAIDTATGLPPEDPFAGFLPPEDGTGRGQGQVAFSVKPKPGVVAGTRITNTASIVFDTNDPIETDPAAWNTIGELGQLHFNTIAYSVDENSGSVTVSVARTRGNAGEVTVNYSTSDGTATAGSDYTTMSGTLTFVDGDAATKSITVPILDDVSVEDDETVILTLSRPGGGATLGSPSTAVITIVDNDAAATCDLAGSDGLITAEDIAVETSYWRKEMDPPYDQDGDNRVTVADIMWYVANMGDPCP